MCSKCGASSRNACVRSESAAYLPGPGRGAVVGLVHDQQVVLAGIDRLAGGGQGLPEEPQRALPLEEVDGGDEPGEVRPRVDVDAPPPAKVTHQLRVHDAEVEAELVPHLVPPLDLQGGRADHEDLPGPVADDEFEGHHARLDGLAQAHVVGDQQVDPRHLDRPHHRVKLVVLDLDAAAERRLDVLVVGRRGGPPAHGVQEGVELLGLVEAGRLGEGDLLDDPGARLDLPDDLQLFAQAVVLDGGERQEVLRPGDRQLASPGRAGCWASPRSPPIGGNAPGRVGPARGWRRGQESSDFLMSERP